MSEVQDKPEKMPPVPPFVQFVASAVPMVFDNSMSYYEALCALWKYIDGMTSVINNNATLEEEYIEKFNELKEFVDTYFDNLDVQEEINNKLDEMAQDGTLEEIMAEYATTKVDYFYIPSTATLADITAAITSPKAKIIEFEKATYTLVGYIPLTSNTTIYLNGATLTSNDGDLHILGYAVNSTWTGYNGIHDVKICNGKVGFSFALMHNANITFSDIEFLDNIKRHAVQVASCKNVKFENCTFDGQKYLDDYFSESELIQLESATRSGQPFLTDPDSVSYDDGGNDGIVIDSCYFKAGNNTTSRFYTGIGHHSSGGVNPYYNNNITITNCIFESAYYSQICPAGFANSVISNNVFNQTDNINTEIYNIRFRSSNKNILVDNNIFIGGYHNISNVNLVYTNDRLIIRNNTFDTEFEDNVGNIIIKNWTNVLIEGNTFKHAYKRNIAVNALDGDNTHVAYVRIENNDFNDANITASDGENIYLGYTSNVVIKNNNVTNNNLRYFVNGDSTRVTSIDIGYNNLIGTASSKKVITGLADYTNITNASVNLYYRDSASYAAVDDGTPTYAFSQFNTLYLALNKNANADYLYTIKIKPFSLRGKLGTRKYPITLVDESGNLASALFTINYDGTFDYTSASSINLRAINGFNEVLY